MLHVFFWKIKETCWQQASKQLRKKLFTQVYFAASKKKKKASKQATSQNMEHKNLFIKVNQTIITLNRSIQTS